MSKIGDWETLGEALRRASAAWNVDIFEMTPGQHGVELRLAALDFFLFLKARGRSDPSVLKQVILHLRSPDVNVLSNGDVLDLLHRLGLEDA